MTSTTLEMAPARARAAWVVPALVALVTGVVAWWASAPYVVGIFQDDGVYLLLAKALATGQGFHYLQLPGAPAATHFPPLYPLALSFLWRIAPDFPDNIPVMLAFNTACLGIAAVGLHAWLRERFGWREEGAALVTLAAMLSTPILTLGGALLSEPLFLAALFPLLRYGERVVEQRDYRSAAYAGLATGLLMLVRTHAIALLAAITLLLLMRRAWRRAALFAGTAVAVQLPWILWTSTAAPVAAPLRGLFGSYAAWFADGLRAGGPWMLVRTAQINLRELWLLLGDRVAPGIPAPLALVTLVFACLLIAVGAARAARRAPVMLLFLLGYVAIVLIVAGPPWRYAYAVWPLCLALGVLGANELIDRAPARVARGAVLVALALPAVALLRTEMKAYAAREWERPTRNATAQVVNAVEWVRRNTLPTDVILTEGEQVVTLFTGRRAAPPAPFTAIEYLVGRSPDATVDELREMIAVVPATYLVSFLPPIQQAARRLQGQRPGTRELPGAPGVAAFEIVR